MFDHPSNTPDYVIDGIPGARKLADEYKAARRDLTSKVAARNAAGERARSVTSGHVRDPERSPAPGVSRKVYEKAHDDYRLADDAVTAAERVLDRLAKSFETVVRRGIRSPEFQERHHALAAAANDDAREALTKLRKALKSRDELNRVLGLRLNLKSYFGIDHAVGELTAYVDAQPTRESNFRAAALDHLESGIKLPAERKAALDAMNRIDALDVTDAEKLRMFLAEVGR